MQYPIPLPEKNGVQVVMALLGHIAPDTIHPPHDAIETISECRILQHEHDSLNNPVQWSVRQIRTQDTVLQIDAFKTLIGHQHAIQIVDGSVLYDLAESIALGEDAVCYDRYWYRNRPLIYLDGDRTVSTMVDYVVYQFMDRQQLYASWSVLLIDLSQLYREDADRLASIEIDPLQAFPFMFKMIYRIDLSNMTLREELDALFAPYLGVPRRHLWL